MIHVLIVEDDPMVAKLNKRYVESVQGYKVVGAVSNGEEALKLLKSSKIDLILLDVYMPKLDGITLLKEMRKKGIMADVILVTATREADNIDAVLKLGAVDYLIKPFEYERLKNALDNYFMRYHLLHSKERIQQQDIDRITQRKTVKADDTLQKGLHKKTLERIRNFMKRNSESLLSSEEVARKMGLSRVTVKRYLEYLVSVGELQLEIEYGSIGRPSHLYQYRQDLCPF